MGIEINEQSLIVSKTSRLKAALFFGAAIAPLFLVACHKEGPAESAGKSIDNAAQKVQDAVDPPGPAEKAGRAIDNATGK